MKKILLNLFLFLIATNIFAETGTYKSINEIKTILSTTYNYEYGGYTIPSTGSINVLIIFAEFPDDKYDTTNTLWQKGSLPQNMSGWVDQTWSATPTQGSLTDYFNVMSLKRLHVTGQTVHVIAPKTRTTYHNSGLLYGDIQHEIIDTLNKTMNFSAFDNFGRTAPYTFNNSPDGQVDMIFFIWRNVDHDINYNLGLWASFGDLGGIGNFYVDGGSTRWINTNDWGSGVTIKSYLGDGYDGDPLRIAIHEFSHYLLGANDMHNGFGFWGMLADYGTKSYVANSFERYQLGWIDNPTGHTINANTLNNVTQIDSLYDYVTTGRSYRIIIDASNTEYFYIENHQNLSYWETHAPFTNHPNNVDGIVENGIYVIRQKGMANNDQQFAKMLIPAEGRFTWNAVSSIRNPYDNTKILPVWYKGAPNITAGNHALELVPHTYNYTGIENPSLINFVRETLTIKLLLPARCMAMGGMHFELVIMKCFHHGVILIIREHPIQLQDLVLQ